MIRFSHVTLCFFCLYSNVCFSQTLFSNVKYQVEAGTYLSTSGVTPFWLRSNQYGIVPLQSPTLTFRGSAHKEYDSTKNENHKLKKFGIGYGFWGITNVGKQGSILLPEAYLKIRYGAFEFYGGRRREIMGLVDTTLTSGSYIWSGNALPMPKIQISIPNYISIIGHGIISIKGCFAHGWFGNQTYVQKYYLHQKSLYGRVGKSKWKINFYAGLNHQVQWGGYSPFLINYTYASQNGYLPSDFNAFMSIAFPFPSVRKAFPPKIKITYDSDNYGGNQLGSVDFATEIKFKKMSLLVYRQLPYELGSLFSSLVNADDGLYGISIKLPKPFHSIKKVTIEGFHSFNQGGYRSGIARIFNLKDKHFGEFHSYLTHGQYNDGWSYNDFGMGTPLILNDSQSRPAFNQVKSIYFAIEGKIVKLNYGLKYNYSCYRAIKPITQYSFVAYGKFNWKRNVDMKFSFANDSDILSNKSVGISLSMIKTWY